jgi:hypothetical protein
VNRAATAAEQVALTHQFFDLIAGRGRRAA